MSDATRRVAAPDMIRERAWGGDARRIVPDNNAPQGLRVGFRFTGASSSISGFMVFATRTTAKRFFKA